MASLFVLIPRLSFALTALLSVSVSPQAALAADKAVVVGTTAPDFSGKELDGMAFSLAELSGRVVYLDFWASWCPPCRVSLPWMEMIRERYSKEQFSVVTVNLDSDPSAAVQMLKEVNAQFVTVSDPSGSIARLFSAPAMPTSYLIDRDGVVRAMVKGFRESEKEPLEEKIKELLR
jgi:thiol-disulfide isomerase/thioredoxin